MKVSSIPSYIHRHIYTNVDVSTFSYNMLQCSVLGRMLVCYIAVQFGIEGTNVNIAKLGSTSTHVIVSVDVLPKCTYMVTMKICYAASAIAVFTENKLNFIFRSLRLDVYVVRNVVI